MRDIESMPARWCVRELARSIQMRVPRPVHWQAMRELPSDYLRERAVQERCDLRGCAGSKDQLQFYLQLHARLRRSNLRYALLHSQKVSERW
jgi:hypothetical protein